MTGLSPTTATSGPRARSIAGRVKTEAALAPVADALVEAARARAQAERGGAEEDARTEFARARAEAEQMLVEARADGEEAAERSAGAQLAMARREAHETILAARRRAYDTLRSNAIKSLERQAASPEGRQLAERLVSLVRKRVGPSASVHRDGSDALAAVAEAGNRRAALGPSALVDWVLESLATEIEALWA